MPQLDKVSFLSQFFWLSLSYLCFYFIVYKYFLPKMSRVLKYRIYKSDSKSIRLDTESIRDTKTEITPFNLVVRSCITFLYQRKRQAEQWILETVKTANHSGGVVGMSFNQANHGNTAFLSSLGYHNIRLNKLCFQQLLFIRERGRSRFAQETGRVFALYISFALHQNEFTVRSTLEEQVAFLQVATFYLEMAVKDELVYYYIQPRG